MVRDLSINYTKIAASQDSLCQTQLIHILDGRAREQLQLHGTTRKPGEKGHRFERAQFTTYKRAPKPM